MKETNISQQLNQHQFFHRCGQELKSIALNSRIQQDKIRQMKKIEALKNKKEVDEKIDLKFLDNIIIDYLRSLNLNYSYSIVMRERNLISQEIKTKQELVDFLHLSDIYHSTSKFDISILEMMMIRESQWLSNKKETTDGSVQVDLISKDATVNNRLLNEIRIAQVRKEVEQTQKKHYNQMLNTLKKQLTLTIGDDLKKDYEAKMKVLKNDYQKQFQVLKQKNKEFLMNSPKLNPKIEEYLSKIQKLENLNMDLTDKIKQLEKEKIVHNCFKNSKLIERENQIKKERGELQQKKRQYDLALKNIQTSVEDLVAKKAKLHEQPKQTDLFMTELKKNRASKDHMIEEIYGRMFVMDKRIQSIAADNQSLIEQNRQLLCKVKQLEEQKQGFLEKQEKIETIEQKMQKYQIKPKTRDALIGVEEADIKEAFIDKKQHVIDASVSGIDSEEEEEGLRNKEKYRKEVKNITSEMQLLKNRLRFMVEEFQ